MCVIAGLRPLPSKARVPPQDLPIVFLILDHQDALAHVWPNAVDRRRTAGRNFSGPNYQTISENGAFRWAVLDRDGRAAPAAPR
jgi:hypothetical protein